MKPEEPGQHFYNQGAFSLLGFGLHWVADGAVQLRHIDILMRTHNQCSFTALSAFNKAKEFFPKGFKFVYWCDSGRHFRSLLFISHILGDESTASLNFLKADTARTIVTSILALSAGLSKWPRGELHWKH